MRLRGDPVINEINLKEVQGIIKSHSLNNLKHYLDYLTQKSTKRLKDVRLKRHRALRHIYGKEFKQEKKASCNHLVYGLGENNIFLRINQKSMKRHHDWMAWREHVLGQPLVIDFSYLKHITSQKTIKSILIREAAHALKYNREAVTPFALHFTGLTEEMRSIMTEGVHVDDDQFLPVEITDKSQLELFPREKLVYLSPDSKNDLRSFSEDDIYVIGGVADMGHDRAPLTLGQ